MPLYEYTCTSCQQDFEVLMRHGESPSCPECGGQKLDKRFSVPAAHTSGSSQLPVCNAAPRTPCGMGGCGLPECG